MDKMKDIENDESLNYNHTSNINSFFGHYTDDCHVSSLMKGYIFNNHPDYKGKKFYKLLRKDKNHFGFRYKEGLNEDIVAFEKSGSCSGGGLYFTERKNIWRWLKISYYGKDMLYYFCSVSIPDDANVFIEENKFKTNKFILGTEEIVFDNYELCLELVVANKFALKHVNPQIITYEMCKLSVTAYCHSLAFVPEKYKTIELCEIAVCKEGTCLYYIPAKLKTINMCIIGMNRLYSTAPITRYVPIEIFEEIAKRKLGS
jgi:hypothetical protein